MAPLVRGPARADRGKTSTPIDQVVDGGNCAAAGQFYALINGGGFSLVLSGAIDKPSDQALKDIGTSIAKLLLTRAGSVGGGLPDRARRESPVSAATTCGLGGV